MITLETNWIYIKCTSQHAKKLDAVWIKSKDSYRLPHTIGALQELSKMGFDVREHLAKKETQRASLLKLKNSYPDSHQDSRLRPYQQADVRFLQHIPHCGIFNQMRTGKTPTTLKLIEAEDHERIIVLCPASLVLTWKEEVEKWTNYTCLAVKGTKNQRLKKYQLWEQQKGFLVLSKDIAKLDYDLLKPYADGTAFVVDEAHFLRNYKSLQSKAAYQLSKTASKRFAITGTPSTNKGEDIYGILHYLYPTRFTSYWQFVDRYFKTWESPWGRTVSGYKRQKELQELLDVISVQRKRSEVMQWVPPKQYQTVSLEMSAKQKKAYDEMMHLFTVEDAGIDAPSVLAQLTRLRQICLAPSLLGIDAPSAKEQFILEWLANNPQESVIIFSNFSSYLVQLQKKLKGSRLIVGETSKKDRQQAVNHFQAGKTNIILANIEAAGTGLTLDKASTVIFLDRNYVPANNIQAEDRIVPTTEESNMDCLVIDLVCANSIDDKINKMISKKKNIIEVINNYKSIKEIAYT